MPTRPMRFCALAGWAFCLFGHAWAQAQTNSPAVPATGVHFSVLSSDGKWLAMAADNPPRVLIATPALAQVHAIPAQTLHRQTALAVSGIWALPKRGSWLVALAGVTELWEISHNPQAEPIHDGYVHDYRMGESITKPGFLGVRRTQLDSPVKVLGIDHTQTQVLVLPDAQAQQPRPKAEVLHLDIRRRTLQLTLPHPPAPGNAGNGVSTTVGELCIRAADPAATMCLDTSPWAVRMPVARQ